MKIFVQVIELFECGFVLPALFILRQEIPFHKYDVMDLKGRLQCVHSQGHGF